MNSNEQAARVWRLAPAGGLARARAETFFGGGRVKRIGIFVDTKAGKVTK